MFLFEVEIIGNNTTSNNQNYLPCFYSLHIFASDAYTSYTSTIAINPRVLLSIFASNVIICIPHLVARYIASFWAVNPITPVPVYGLSRFQNL